MIYSKWFNSERHTFNLSFSKKSLTLQSEKDSCDINKVLSRYARIGELPKQNDLRYDDVTSLQRDFTVVMQDSINNLQQYEQDLMNHNKKLEDAKRSENDELKRRIAELEASKINNDS